MSEGSGYVRQGAFLNLCGFIKSRINPEVTRENQAEEGNTGIEKGSEAPAPGLPMGREPAVSNPVPVAPPFIPQAVSETD